MPSQAEYQKIKTAVLDPLGRIYGKTFTPEEIDDYTDSLGRYDEPTLKKAMVDIRENETRRPVIAHIVQAVKKIKKAPEGGGISEWYEKFLQEQAAKLARAEAAAKRYAEEFCRDNQRLKALAPPQQQDLSDCIYQAAFLQAQFIEGIRNRGYGSHWLDTRRENWEERLKWWLEMCHRNAKTGSINVEVPWIWYERISV